MKKFTTALAIIICIALALAGCGGGGAAPTTQAAETTAAAAAAETTTTAAPTTQTAAATTTTAATQAASTSAARDAATAGTFATTVATTEAAPVEAADVENFNVTGFPIVNEPITLTIMGQKNDVAGPWDSLRFFVYMEELTNIKFDYQEVNNSVWTERKNLAFASGTYTDVIFGGAVNHAEQVMYGVEDGILLPLNEYIDKYAPNFQTALQARPETIGMITAYDGNIYAFPQVASSPVSVPEHYYNLNWFYALGLDPVNDIPETLDEFYDLMVRFKNEDPNQNGLQDEIPYCIRIGSALDNPPGASVNNLILPAYGIPNSRQYVDDNGEIQIGYFHENYALYVDYVKRLMDEEIIDPEIYVMDDMTMNGKCKTNLAGFVNGHIYSRFDVPDPEVAALYPKAIPFKSEYLGGGQALRAGGNAISVGTLVFTDKCQYPEAMTRWADYIYSEEGSLRIHYGEEGDLWERAENGMMRYIIPSNGMTVDEYRAAEVTPDGGTTVPKFIRPATEGDWDDPFQQARVEYWWSTLFPIGKVPFPTMFYTSEENSRKTALEADIFRFFNEKEAAYFTGREDFRADRDNLINTFKTMGGDELLEIYKGAYERYTQIMNQ